MIYYQGNDLLPRVGNELVRLKENNNCCISENGYKLAGLHYYKVGAHKILLGETQLSPTTTEVVLIGLAKGTSGSCWELDGLLS